MASLYHRNPLEENIKCLIRHYEGTTALEAEDNEGYTVLNLAASIKESAYTKKIIKVRRGSVHTLNTCIHVLLQLLLKAGANVNQENHSGFNARDTANQYKNLAVKVMLSDYMNGNDDRNHGSWWCNIL